MRPKVTPYGVVLHLLCLAEELKGFEFFPKCFFLALR